MKPVSLIENIPEITGKKFSLFRYDRWGKILFLDEISGDHILAFIKCNKFAFYQDLFIDRAYVVEENGGITRVSETTSCFTVECEKFELWNREQFDSYDYELFTKLGDDKRYGIRRKICSVLELEE